MKFTIKNDELASLNNSNTPVFPKYTSQLINWANQNAQGTRPKVVGQLSVLFPEYENECGTPSLGDWEQWYLKRYPNAIETATEKIYAQVENLKNAIPLITKDMIRDWVKDLVITKTFNGLYFQQAILAKLSEIKHAGYRLATPEEESKGIDGYVGSVPYSIKPLTYKTMGRLPELINVKMIYYNKTKIGVSVEVEE